MSSVKKKIKQKKKRAEKAKAARRPPPAKRDELAAFKFAEEQYPYLLMCFRMALEALQEEAAEAKKDKAHAQFVAFNHGMFLANCRNVYRALPAELAEEFMPDAKTFLDRPTGDMLECYNQMMGSDARLVDGKGLSWKLPKEAAS